MKIRIPLLHCERCGHDWTPRVDRKDSQTITGKDGVQYAVIEVIMCPACKTPYWDKPRKVKPPIG